MKRHVMRKLPRLKLRDPFGLARNESPFKQKVVEDKSKYKRNRKHKGKKQDD